ncbi:hypothetical protein MNBD_GAMMA17-826 [hydrothermal vent metagenome]|uniref:Uncharacterized protein n=1 Tax=hydrothermal vent metagenome TaxID=652676 RepID=A0A3B0ZE77_9ZZZZ
MSLQTLRHPLSYLLAPLLAIALTVGFNQPAQAHKGHAGPKVTFIKTKAALKEMLPSGAKIVKRKQPLKRGCRRMGRENLGRRTGRWTL